MRFVLLALVVVALPFTASAKKLDADCPQLNGHFTCTYDGQFGHKVFELDGHTVRDQRGQTVYIVNKKEVYTDGQMHHTDSLPILEQWADDVNYKGTCSGPNQVHIVGDARVKRFGSRADLDGDLIADDRQNLRVLFRVEMGFFGSDFDVPCVRR